jgi:hypothetical protein
VTTPLLDPPVKHALEVLLAYVDQDHQRVALALGGLPSAAPRDRQLAALHRAIVTSQIPCTLVDMAVEHPEAAARHLVWATATLHQAGAPTAWCGVAAPVPAVALPLAS